VKPIPTPKNVVTHLRAMHDRLNDGWANVDDAWWTSEAATIIERLVRQRDEADATLVRMKIERQDARILCCYADAGGDSNKAREVAAKHGWDCFPEEVTDAQ
jgi:hypothetical protein